MVTDALRIVTQNTAAHVGGNYLTGRYADLVYPPEVDSRSGEQIAADVIKGAGLVVIED